MIKKKMNRLMIFLAFCLGFSACSENKAYQTIETQTIRYSRLDKTVEKPVAAMLSLAYSDLYGEAMSSQLVSRYELAFQNFGDREVVRTLATRSLLETSLQQGIQVAGFFDVMPGKVLTDPEKPSAPASWLYLGYTYFHLININDRDKGEAAFYDWAEKSLRTVPWDLSSEGLDPGKAEPFVTSVGNWAANHPDDFRKVRLLVETEMFPTWEKVGVDGYPGLRKLILLHFASFASEYGGAETPSLKLPGSRNEVMADIPGFISNVYKQFYNRKPDPYENWYWTRLIETDSTFSPLSFYLAIMQSDEYSFY
jgi:hypothetical protein